MPTTKSPLRRPQRRCHVRRAERGQMLVLFALLIVPVTFVIGVIAVDASFWQSERRRSQTAAVLAALASS
jgi:hypothetical protein